MIKYVFALTVLVTVYFLIKRWFRKKERVFKKAICILKGENNKIIKGIVYLNELADGNTHIYGKIIGLPLGKHAFHIHETGNLLQGCKSLGGHYNPFNKNHSGRVIKDSSGNIEINYNRHVGDLGNIVTNKKGEATINFVDPLIKLYGKYSVIGRSLVIHEGEDDLGKGGTKESLTTGSAGARIACGIIAFK